MLPRARETTKWAWDDVPVQSMRAAKWMPSWWNALESELMTADTSSVYADHHTLQEEEREAIHRCALLYHARRMKTAKEAELRSVGLRRSHHAHSEAKDANLSGVLLTPRYQGRAPGTGFMVRQYLQSTEDVHRVAFQQPLGLQQRRSAQLQRR